MTVFTAYFDASGHPSHVASSASLFVTGLLSTVERWAKFDAEWLALLVEFGIAPPFHTTDFESGNRQYAAWKDDIPLREQFRARALSVIKRWTNKPFSAGVVVADLRRLVTEYDLPAHFPTEPYLFCGGQAIKMVKEWAERGVRDGRLHGKDKIDIIFEHGDKHRGQLEKFLQTVHGVPIQFQNKSEVIAFQACDFLAWQHRRWLTDRETHGPRSYRPRKAVIEVARVLPGDSSTFANWAGLVRECEAWGIQKRPVSPHAVPEVPNT
jgi:hypothetical protein